MADVDCNETVKFGIYSGSSMVISALFIFNVNRLFCKKASNHKIKMLPSLKIIGLIHVVSYLLMYIQNGTLSALLVFDIILEGSQFEHIMFLINPCLGTAGLLSFFVFIIYRLHHIFQGTMYEISKFTLIAYSLIAVIISVFWIFPDGTPYPVIGSILIPIFGCCLSYSFIHRLYLLIISQDNHTSHLMSVDFDNENRMSQSVTISSDDIELTRQQLSLLDTVIKNTILNVNGIMGYILFSVLYIPIELDLISGPNKQQLCAIDYVVIGFYALAVLSEILCVVLGYHVNHGSYLKICGYCHGKCVAYGQSVTKQKIANSLSSSDRYHKL